MLQLCTAKKIKGLPLFLAVHNTPLFHAANVQAQPRQFTAATFCQKILMPGGSCSAPSGPAWPGQPMCQVKNFFYQSTGNCHSVKIPTKNTNFHKRLSFRFFLVRIHKILIFVIQGLPWIKICMKSHYIYRL